MAGNNDLEMLEEYDFSRGIRGKYAERAASGTNIVRLDDDVAAMFPDSKSVNNALRALGKIILEYEEHSRAGGST